MRAKETSRSESLDSKSTYFLHITIGRGRTRGGVGAGSNSSMQLKD